MKTFLTLLLISIVLLSSCQKQELDDTLLRFDFDSFEMVDLTNSKFEIISNGNGMSNPSNIRIVNDSIIVIRDTKSRPNNLWSLNIRTGNIVPFLLYGKSTNEAVDITNIWADSGSVYCYDTSGKILRTDLNWNDNGFTTEKIAQVSVNAYRAINIDDNHYMTMTYEGRYKIVDKQDSIISEFGVFPIKNEIANNSVCQIDVETSPDQQLIVCANRQWPQIELYRRDGSLQMLLSGPSEIEAEIKRVDFSETTYAMVQSPGYSCYHCISSNKNDFFVGYIGKKNKENPDFNKGVNTILSFAWDGQPKCLYKFGHYIKHFDYDDSNGVLYCLIECDDRYQVAKYKL